MAAKVTEAQHDRRTASIGKVFHAQQMSSERFPGYILEQPTQTPPPPALARSVGARSQVIERCIGDFMTQARENALAKHTASVGLGITRAPARVETQEYYGCIRSSDKRLWQERSINVQPGRGSIVEHVNETTVRGEHVRCTRRQVNPRILHHSKVISLFANA